MAHFAKLSDENLVLHVEVVDNSIITDENGDEQESLGIAYLTEIHGWPHWKQTSYNTNNGKHWTMENDDLQHSADQTKAFRKNYATIGGKYDASRDAFIPKKPHASWTLNETTCQWEAPVEEPVQDFGVDGQDADKFMYWNETTGTWDATTNDESVVRWDPDTSTWNPV